MSEKEKKVRDKTGKGQREMCRAETKEHEVAQKIYWIVIDRKDFGPRNWRGLC